VSDRETEYGVEPDAAILAVMARPATSSMPPGGDLPLDSRISKTIVPAAQATAQGAFWIRRAAERSTRSRPDPHRRPRPSPGCRGPSCIARLDPQRYVVGPSGYPAAATEGLSPRMGARADAPPASRS
jgi:hypothetical protein